MRPPAAMASFIPFDMPIAPGGMLSIFTVAAPGPERGACGTNPRGDVVTCRPSAPEGAGGEEGMRAGIATASGIGVTIGVGMCGRRGEGPRAGIDPLDGLPDTRGEGATTCGVAGVTK